jgi:outer membrane protein assembly factor BamB
MLFRRPATLAILTSTLIASVSAAASDWAQWRGPDRSGHVPENVAVPTTLAAEPKVLWHVPIGEGFASPVVAAGKVYYVDNPNGKEVVHCANAEDGKDIWQSELDDAFKDGFGMGPRCTPVVDGERVFAQSCKGEFHCLQASDGKIVWKKNFVTDFGAVFIGEKGQAAGGQRHGNNGAPVVDGENIIVQVGSPKDAALVCMKKATGEVVWKSQKDQTAYAPPIVATIAGIKQVVSFTTEAVIGVKTSDGALLWRVPVKTALGRHVTTPVVYDDIVCVASHQAGLVAVKITKDGEGQKAETIWTEKPLAINFSSPVVVDGLLYGPGPQKNIFCCDIKTGETKWSKTSLLLSSADKVHAALMVMHKNILLLTDTGTLILFAADPAEYKEIARAQVCGFNWCNPAYADGKLYLRDKKELMCVQLME